MKYIAIDTAGDPAAILVTCGEKTLFRAVTEQKRTSEVLLPKLDEMLDECKLSLPELDFLAVVTGPGSFTGIRIGVNTVKTFSYVNGTPVVAIDALEKLTYNYLPGEANRIICAVHAYANFCYLAIYDKDGNVIETPDALEYTAARELIEGDKNAAIIADGAACERLGASCIRDNPNVSLARAAESFYASGKTVNHAAVEPFYIMKSQAERELEIKEKRG